MRTLAEETRSLILPAFHGLDRVQSASDSADEWAES